MARKTSSLALKDLGETLGKGSYEYRFMKFKMLMGRQIAYYRVSNNISQIVLSETLGISVNTLRNWENGMITPYAIFTLYDRLNFRILLPYDQIQVDVLNPAKYFNTKL